MKLVQSLRELSNPRFVHLWISSFLLGVCNAPVNNLLPVYIEAETGGSPLFSAGLRSTFLLLGGLSAVPAGFLCDRIGSRSVYILGTTGAITAGGVFLVQQPAWLFLLCVYIGLASGLSTTASQSYFIQAVPRASMGLGAAAFFLGLTLGSAVGSRLTGQLAESYGFAVIGAGVVVCVMLVLIGLFLFLPQLERNPAPSTRFYPGSMELLQRPAIQLLIGVRFLPTCYWGTATLLIPLLIYRYSGSLTLAADYAALSLVVAAACQLLTGRLADFFGPRKPTLVASSGVAISAIGVGLWSESIPGLFIFGTTSAACAWSVSTMMPRLIDAVAGPAEKGRVVGLAHLAWSLAMLTGSLWGGRAIAWGPGIPFYGMAVGCVATVVLLTLLFHQLEEK